MDDERPPSLWWGMWKRFLIGGVADRALSGGATATVALNTVSSIAHEVFPTLNQINAPKGLVTPEYNGGPQTFLILGSDRRVGLARTPTTATTRRTATRSCWCASTPNRARPRCCRSRAT